VSALQLPPLGLYIHIPWCARKCPYCDFNSHEHQQPIPESDYVAALLADLDGDLPLAQGRSLHSIFFGGGTPSLLSARAIGDILDGVRARIPLKEGAEITLEANPGSAEADKFHGFKEAGVNRISLGIQSFSDQRLQDLGRIHSSEQAIIAIEIAQGIGLDSFNIDLMHGLPGQSLEEAIADLQIASAYLPPHLSWYQLTIEPNTAFFKNPPRLPAERLLADIQDRGELLLEEQGYCSYEVSAFAQAGYRCHHNLNYWLFGDYLGIGAGAHSKLTDLGRQRVLRRAKRRQPERYLDSNPDDFCATERHLEEADLVAEFMLNALRLQAGFNEADFAARTGLEFNLLEPNLNSLCERKLLVREEGRVRASGLGRRYLDSVIAEFV
jgi:putative oxygen-independent coproporphyrinogen III oxidase